jgi:alkyldihydroxyacetonephosphate synthase
MNAPEATAPAMKWWGWGDPGRSLDLPETALGLLRSELGGAGRSVRPVELEQVRLAEPRLAEKTRNRLQAIVGEWVRDDRLTRVSHAAGRGYPDLLRLRAGLADPAPDAVVYAGGDQEVRAVLDLCASERIAVVPFGGGTSVVGGVEPLGDSRAAVVSLDMARMTAVTNVDERSLTASFGPGLRGPRVEEQLARHGLTLGHFPQSFEYATVGGWVATRSAGQASTGYGSIEKLVAGLRLVTPTGSIDLPPMPATAAGPGLRQLLVGSEGVLGVITEATMKLRPRPVERRYEGWMFHAFEEGVEALRTLEQREVIPDVARLLDDNETRLSLALAGGGSLRGRLGRRYVDLRGYGAGCLAILGFEGEPTDVRRRRSVAERLVRRGGGLPLGASPGRAWERDRYAGPYLRDALLDQGLMVETLETAHQWSSLTGLHQAVREAIEHALAACGTPGLVMCHVSHLYPNGASLYFTFLARQREGDELEQWRAVKTAASDAIVEAGGTITHHHAIGRDHTAWMRREVGDLGVELLRSVKASLDPAGILNPGKLLPDKEDR